MSYLGDIRKGEKMKFVHIADMHLDSPFTGISAIKNLGDIRRLEQRKVFKKVIDFIKENEIDYLFIAGDLYEQEYIRKSTIEYINQLFCEISNTKVLIAPGNHDPYIKGSYYADFEWSENVYIGKKDWEMLEEPEVDIYMTAFTDFYMSQSPIENMKIQNPNKMKILLTHCDLNGAKDENGFSYHPVSENAINQLEFDYVAMGHIHKTNFKENAKIIYPGSTISFGFDELGEHGMVVGEITNHELKTKFIRLDDRIFTKQELNVDNILSKEELVETIDNLNFDENTMVEIVLVGSREFEIVSREILKLISHKSILKIKDNTQIGYNIEEIAKENNLRGIFVREVIKKYEEGIYTEEQIKKAIEIGLNAM